MIRFSASVNCSNDEDVNYAEFLQKVEFIRELVPVIGILFGVYSYMCVFIDD